MRLILTILLLTSFAVKAQKIDKSLTSQLTEIVRDFKGDVGVYVRHLKTGQMVSINADTLFPTASMIKVPISIGVFSKIEKCELQYDSTFIYKDSLLYEGEDILGSFKNGEKISLSKLLMLMITTSDNTASLWCQSIAGGGLEINKWLEENGFRNIRVNSRTPGRELIRAKYGWGQTSPREMAELIVRLHQGKVISPRVSERIYRNLGRIYWDGESLSEIPPYVHTASKTGAVNQSRSEVVLVNAPHGDYVFCVITKNQQDESWKRDNAGYVLLRNISKLLWNYFEPNSKWKPAEKIDEWWY